MADEENPNFRDKITESKSSSSTFVYPVKSLLSGLRTPQKRRDSETPPEPRPSGNVDSASFRRSSSALNQAKNTSTIRNERHAETSTTSASADSEVVAHASANLSVPSSSSSIDDAPDLAFNLSQAGIVHLAPPPDDDRSVESYSFSGHSTSSSLGAAPTTVALRQSDELSIRSFRSSLSLGSSSSSVPLVTVRYDHVEDENGNHVIVGRGGELTRCEEEPIHAPGAVQGFGVLVAVEDDPETGNLRVRQVSENSREILGLSARYLFSLDCFTQVLPDAQSDILWDNIQFMYDSEAESGDQTDAWEGPQVFLLSGWGEPGSKPMTDDEEVESSSAMAETDRLFWTCWCAAHRPPPIRGPGDSTSELSGALVILEFELERDLYNPLYATADPSVAEASESGSGTDPTPTGNSLRYSGLLTPSSDTKSQSARARDLTEINRPSKTQQKQSSPSSPQYTSFSANETAMSAITKINMAELFLSSEAGLRGDEDWYPLSEAIFDSTISQSRPLKALERMRRVDRTPGSDPSSRTSRSGVDKNKRARARATRSSNNRSIAGVLDVFSVLTQINDQMSAAQDLDSFLKIVVGVMKDLTQFHRVLVYQFDELWNGQVVAELVDWRQTHDLYKGLHFPASDIPAQARELYRANKVRLLYDRSQSTARLVVRDRSDLERPLNMTHSYLRAMSPIHVQYLANMGVRSSMSISVVSFGALWGLISCHSYGSTGMRVSFPVRQMLRLLSDSVSRNVERLSYAQRLRTRKLINTLPADSHPTGYIVSNVDDLLELFDADFGILVIGEGAKIFGPNNHGQEVLLIAEYLRLKHYNLMQASKSIRADFPDLLLPSSLDVIAGLLYVPLSGSGKDFIAFLRKGQLREVHWAGKPYKDDEEGRSSLEPRKSFKAWSEYVAGKARPWTDEEMETAGVLALVYGKFIEVWRQKENAIKSTHFTNILLSNASHEVRTPLNHIINYLEMALNGPLDFETRENLSRSHTASKSLLFTINDLLDLTKLESGKETSFNEPFNLHATIEEAVQLYRVEAERRQLQFHLDISSVPRVVIGDSKKIRTVIANLTANAVKYTREGSIKISCRQHYEPVGLRDDGQVALEITVSDTGCGIESSKLESMFREFEQVEYSATKDINFPGLGLGLAVVARIVEQLGGQLRVDSKPNEGSHFSFLIPFTVFDENAPQSQSLMPPAPLHERSIQKSRSKSSSSSELEDIVEALGTNPLRHGIYGSRREKSTSPSSSKRSLSPPKDGKFDIPDSAYPLKSIKVDSYSIESSTQTNTFVRPTNSITSTSSRITPSLKSLLRILIVEDDIINRTILQKRLRLDGHDVRSTCNGQECIELLEMDQDFDCILMDIQMPILNGFDATSRFRSFEVPAAAIPPRESIRFSKKLNGRVPIFAVSASLQEKQKDAMIMYGMDGWILKPIDFKRLRKILEGIHDSEQRQSDIYTPGCSWENGGWLIGPHL